MHVQLPMLLMGQLLETPGAPFNSASSRNCSFLCSFIFSSCGTIKRLTISAACMWHMDQLHICLNGLTATEWPHSASLSRSLRFPCINSQSLCQLHLVQGILGVCSYEDMQVLIVAWICKSSTASTAVLD